MNSNDISRLSYKELQALAVRYRVPGNIKKKILIKVLQAARGGDKDEVGKLLQDLKHTRKKRERKRKAENLGITSTPIHSPSYSMADDHYCPQQQPPYQWIGAEEEIVSKEDDNKIPHYEEFKQFLLQKIQREFQTYDTNNNQMSEELPIIDLRTIEVPSNVHAVPVEVANYAKTNIVAVSNTNSLSYPSTEPVEYRILEDSNGNAHGSILLKKMLQAPVGANLGEIASPILGGYRTWSIEQYQPNNLLDNSDTLTAESDNVNENCLITNAECYGLLNMVKGEYYLNDPHLVKNQEIGQELCNALSNDVNTRQKYTYTEIDGNHNDQNWIGGNWKDANTAYAESNMTALKVCDSMYSNKEVPNITKSCVSENQYYVANATAAYNTHHNVFSLHPHEESTFYHTDATPNASSDSTNSIHLQNLLNQNAGNNEDYFHHIYSSIHANETPTPLASFAQQTLSNDIDYYTNINCHYSYSQGSQQMNFPVTENIDAQEGGDILNREPYCDKSNELERLHSSQSGILSSYVSKKSSINSTASPLENILNFRMSTCVDYAKINQTSCVYCYTAPVVTQQPVLSNVTCSQRKRFVAEHRQHSFSPHWLLYNGTMSGTEINYVQKNIEHNIQAEEKGMYKTSSGTSEFRELADESENSINDVWMHDYRNYPSIGQRDVNLNENTNTEATDSLLSTISAEVDVLQIEGNCANQVQGCLNY